MFGGLIGILVLILIFVIVWIFVDWMLKKIGMAGEYHNIIMGILGLIFILIILSRVLGWV